MLGTVADVGGIVDEVVAPLPPIVVPTPTVPALPPVPAPLPEAQLGPWLGLTPWMWSWIPLAMESPTVWTGP